MRFISRTNSHSNLEIFAGRYTSFVTDVVGYSLSRFLSFFSLRLPLKLSLFITTNILKGWNAYTRSAGRSIPVRLAQSVPPSSPGLTIRET